MEQDHNIEMEDSHGFFGPVISVYTREDAIADGVLVDLTDLFPADTRLYKYPVACTAAVWGLIEDACPKDDHGHILESSYAAAWVWDLCWMSIMYKTRVISESQHFFTCTIGRRAHEFQAVCGPGDDLEPVITIMMPDED